MSKGRARDSSPACKCQENGIHVTLHDLSPEAAPSGRTKRDRPESEPRQGRTLVKLPSQNLSPVLDK